MSQRALPIESAASEELCDDIFQERSAMTQAKELLRNSTNVIGLEDLDYGRPLRASARHIQATWCRLGELGGHQEADTQGFAEDVRQLVVGFGVDGGGGEKRIQCSLKRAQHGVSMSRKPFAGRGWLVW